MIPTVMNPMGISLYDRRLQYLASTGTQWINTGYMATEHTVIQILASYGAISPADGMATAVAGVRSETGHIGYVMNGKNDAYIQFSAVITPTGDSYVYADQRDPTLILLTKDGCYVNDRLIFTPYNTNGLESAALYLFAQHNPEGPALIGNIRIYDCRISEAGTLAQHLIPVLDRGGVPCMYDTVSRTFKYNAGTGTFDYA